MALVALAARRPPLHAGLAERRGRNRLGVPDVISYRFIRKLSHAKHTLAEGSVSDVVGRHLAPLDTLFGSRGMKATV